MPSPTVKALSACLFFAAVGAFAWLRDPDSAVSIPLFIYFTVLLINTFFSIRAFSAITPQNTVQTLFDMVLAGIYCALAFSFGSALLFSGISTGLFLVAIGKYLHLSRLIAMPEFLARKIKINALGALLSFSALSVAAFGYADIAAWTLGTVFSLANVYLLVLNPMYRLNE
jgi:hypothetical protein